MRERGSVLLLMPAACLVMILLGSIALDLSLVYLAHDDLLTAAQAAADDAVTYGFDEAAFRDRGVYALDPDRVREAVERSLAGRGLLGRVATPVVHIDGLTVEVRLEEVVRAVFAPAIPGIAHTTPVAATGIAIAVEGS